ncbi:MAG: hypothetical protein GY787_11425 [Alteromonadales bacterium]|nr:hypothetical protein [Alteromonadales bacterium]
MKSTYNKFVLKTEFTNLRAYVDYSGRSYYRHLRGVLIEDLVLLTKIPAQEITGMTMLSHVHRHD